MANPKSMDKPDSVADIVVWRLRNSLPLGCVASRGWYCWYWSRYLGCDLTMDEADSILGRINGLGPHEYKETWGAVERSSETFWSTFMSPCPKSRVASAANAILEGDLREVERLTAILDAEPARWKDECIGFDSEGRVVIAQRSRVE